MNAAARLVRTLAGESILNEVWFLSKKLKIFLGRELTKEDEAVIAIISKYVRHGCTVLDIGANVGLYAGRLAKLVGQQGRILVFEPYPPCFKNLMRFWRHARNIEAYDYALSDKDCYLDFCIPSEGLSYTTAAVEETADQLRVQGSKASFKRIRIRAHVLDDLYDELDLRNVCLIKCDVEGHELMIMRGAKHLLAKHKPAIMLEILREKWVGGNPYKSAVFELLSAIGYMMYQIQGDRVGNPNDFDPRFENFLLTPRSGLS